MKSYTDAELADLIAKITAAITPDPPLHVDLQLDAMSYAIGWLMLHVGGPLGFDAQLIRLIGRLSHFQRSLRPEDLKSTAAWHRKVFGEISDAFSSEGENENGLGKN